MAGDKLDDFINEILDKKQLSGMTNEVRDQLVLDLKDRLLDQINRAIIDSLPDNKLEEFNIYLESAPRADEDVQQFINQCGVDLNQVAAKTMLLFRDLYLQTPNQRAA